VKHKYTAFVLLEVAIALVVLGIMGLASFNAIGQASKQRKIHLTSTRMENMLTVLGSYVRSHGRLPCPAAAPELSDQRGMERATCYVGAAFKGIVPYKTLGLAESEARDGWGRWITYAIAPALALSPTEVSASPGKTDAYCAAAPVAGSTLTVVNGDGAPLMVESPTDFISLVLISHGPSGGGALTENGEQLPTTDISKSFNADESPRFVDKFLTPTFDDTVRWVTRDNLMALYGKEPCSR
jgi:type II secretory pathway pseudopilin PulG